MANPSSIALIGSLVGDPARAAMLAALMSGKALTASELSAVAGIGRATASGHLAKLVDGGLVLRMVQGRHRYFRIANADVAGMIETLMGLAAAGAASAVRTGPREASLRKARVCYDHLAGEEGVRLVHALVSVGHLAQADGAFSVTAQGRRAFLDIGVDIASLERLRRPLCRACLDWSERRFHLAGSLGAALLTRFEELGWFRRSGTERALTLTPGGELGLRRLGYRPPDSDPRLGDG